MSATAAETNRAEARPVLQLVNITKTYSSRAGFFGKGGGTVVALDGVSLSVPKGGVYGLVGESGSGKTTAGRLVVGLERADSGSILLDGAEVTGLKGRAMKAFRQRVQMVFQDPYQSLNPQLTIGESVAEPLITFGMCPPTQREEKVLTALKLVGLSPAEEFIHRFPHQLSGGQRQRVAIARAMIVEPEVLVADEPTSMLDASYSAHIFEILLNVRRHFGTTILFITHSLAAARYLCDQVAVIYRGHMMEMGPADQVIADPRHPYTQALLDATPKFAGLEADCEGPKRFDTLLKAERPALDTVGCGFFRRCALAHAVRCGRDRPPLYQVDSGRTAACHYAQPGFEPPERAGNGCELRA